MKFDNKYRILLYKGYLDAGIGLTNYFKYFIVLFGLYSYTAKIDLRLTFILAIFYGIFCFFLGYLYYKHDWLKAQNEVNNKFNLFVEEMRKRKI